MKPSSWRGGFSCVDMVKLWVQGRSWHQKLLTYPVSGRAPAHDKCFPQHCKKIRVQKAGPELTGQLIQKAVHLLHVSNGLLGKMAIRSMFGSINENGAESLKPKYFLLTSMMCFGIKSSLGYDTQVYNKINKRALKDRERGITPGNGALWHVWCYWILWEITNFNYCFSKLISSISPKYTGFYGDSCA